MDRPLTHQPVNPEGLLPPEGFSHAVVAAPGRTVHLGGQTGHRADGTLADDLVAQFDQALANLVTVLRAAGAEPTHLVSLQLYVTDAAAYRAALPDLGTAWRRHLGRWYPAVALFEVPRLFDPDARVELLGVAVIPD